MSWPRPPSGTPSTAMSKDNKIHKDGRAIELVEMLRYMMYVQWAFVRMTEGSIDGIGECNGISSDFSERGKLKQNNTALRL